MQNNGYNQGYNAFNGAYNNSYVPFVPNHQAPKPKRSGAVYTELKKGKYAGTGLPVVNAWRLTKNGIQKATAHPYGDAGKVHVGKQKGNSFVTYTVTVSNDTAGTSQVYYTTMRIDTKKINIPQLGLVISPNGQGYTKTGKLVNGFFGRNYKR